MQRRKLLIGIASAPLWLSACGGGSSGSPSGAAPLDVSHPTSDASPEPADPGEPLSRKGDFEPLTGDTFYIDHPVYGAFDATLQPVRDLPVDAQLEQFTLEFTLPKGADLAEGSHPITHYQSGKRFDIFLQPGHTDDAYSERYYAFFSHIQ